MTGSWTRSRQRLAALTQIAHEVDSAPDLEHALDVLVRLTRQVIEADVCTVYFADEEKRRYVVAATDGLSSRVVGTVECGFGKGLVGRVAGERRPVNLAQVPAELDEEFMLQTGSGPYRGFLGVPVTHKGRVQGVLLVRQHRMRRFNDADEAFLTTLAAQLSGAIAYAKASGEWCWFNRPTDSLPRQIDGLAGAPGIAIGQGLAVLGTPEIDIVPDRRVADTGAEETRLRAAVAAVRAESVALGAELDTTLSTADRALFDAYVLLLDSPEILEAAVALVRRGLWAPGAIRQVIEDSAGRFDAMEDSYLRERAADIRALGGRILARLLGEDTAPKAGHEATILVGQSLSALDIGQARTGRLVGVISGDGSSLSHAAILARGLGIPAVMGVAGLPLSHLDGQELVVDGTAGVVHLRVSAAMRKVFTTSMADQRALTEHLDAELTLDAVTADGRPVGLFINAGLSFDPKPLAAAGAAGIGLFRSELPFMRFGRLPSEREQRNLYRKVLQSVAPLPVTLRMLDTGGDKPLPYLDSTEVNPALGIRGIRFLLDHPEIFVTQLRAALRADREFGNLRLLLPMISGCDEWEQSLELVEQAVSRLVEEGVPASRPPVGAMIEVPAAVYQAESLARQADFLSVGTNDLTQYLLAVDRNNPSLSSRLHSAHPALLQALRQIVGAAERAAKPVTVCGEIAGDPAMALLLLGLGFDGLSMSPAALPRVKWAVRKVRSSRMRALAAEALQCERPEAVSALLEAMRNEIGLPTGEVPDARSKPPGDPVVVQ